MSNDRAKKMEKFANVTRILSIYHDYQVYGMQNIPDSGQAILLTNHSLATYDIACLWLAVWREKKRIIRGMGDRLIFKIPFIKNYVKDLGVVKGTQKNAKELLSNGEIVGISPGGMRESLRPSDQKCRLLWAKRKGFIKLSIITGAPIILAACPNADDIFKIYENPITSFIYKKFKIPFPVFRGLGLSMIPRPVKLYHVIAKPIYPPKINKKNFEKQIDEFQKKIILKMADLMTS